MQHTIFVRVKSNAKPCTNRCDFLLHFFPERIRVAVCVNLVRPCFLKKTF